MSLYRDRDICPCCFKLAGYAGHRARQSELREHLACRCKEELLGALNTEPLAELKRTGTGGYWS